MLSYLLFCLQAFPTTLAPTLKHETRQGTKVRKVAIRIAVRSTHCNLFFLFHFPNCACVYLSVLIPSTLPHIKSNNPDPTMQHEPWWHAIHTFPRVVPTCSNLLLHFCVFFFPRSNKPFFVYTSRHSFFLSIHSSCQLPKARKIGNWNFQEM